MLDIYFYYVAFYIIPCIEISKIYVRDKSIFYNRCKGDNHYNHCLTIIKICLPLVFANLHMFNYKMPKGYK
jgi:hypothetical protein